MKINTDGKNSINFSLYSKYSSIIINIVPKTIIAVMKYFNNLVFSILIFTDLRTKIDNTIVNGISINKAIIDQIITNSI